MAKEMTGIGIRLKNLIKEQGMTQQQFAAKCNVSKETLISHFSSENMSIDYIKKCDCFGCIRGLFAFWRRESFIRKRTKKSLSKQRCSSNV